MCAGEINSFDMLFFQILRWQLQLQGRNLICLGGAYMVVDCGGGTVDITGMIQ